MPISISRPSRARAVAAIVLVALAACSSSPTGPLAEGDASVSTDHAVYTIGDGAFAEVRFSFHNRHPATAHVSGCGGEPRPVVERERDGAWTQYAGGPCLTNLDMVAVPVPAGGTRDGAVRVGEPGRYRVRLEYGTNIQRIVRSAVSPAFSVVE